MTPLLGFTPDAEQATPGCILECDEIIPTDNGMKAAPSSASVGLAALAAASRGATVFRNLSGARRLISGTATRLYEAGTTAWTDVSSSTYNLGSDDRWSFCQFGNSALAASITDVIQRSTSVTFAPIAGAPKADIIDSVRGFIMALHTNETINGDSPDRWWCSAYLDETSWTASVSTQATTGRLVEGSGKLTAGARLGDDFVAYKSRATFLGRYDGPPVVWAWTQTSSEIGCVGKGALVNTGVSHLFVGEDDIYEYNGASFRSIADGQVRRWFVEHRDPAHAFRALAMWDRASSLAYFIFASTSSAGVLDQCLVYHTKRQRWGLMTRTVEAVINYVSPAVTYDGGSVLVTNYDAAPMIPFDSPFWLSAAETPGLIESDHTVKTLSGIPGTSTFTSGDFGDDSQETHCPSVRLRFRLQPSSATCSGLTKADAGTAIASPSSTSDLTDGKFDLRQTDQWHRFTFAFTGNTEFNAIEPRLIPAGRRRA